MGYLGGCSCGKNFKVNGQAYRVLAIQSALLARNQDGFLEGKFCTKLGELFASSNKASPESLAQKVSGHLKQQKWGLLHKPRRKRIIPLMKKEYSGTRKNMARGEKIRA